MTTFFWSSTAVNHLWSDAANWTPAGGPPGSGDAAVLGNIGGSVGEAVVISGADVAVDTLIVGLAATNAPTLTVDSGRTFTINSTGSSIDDGSIIVQTGATMVWNFSATFSNQGTIVIGEILNSNGGNGTLAIDGAVTLNDGGTVDLGQVSNAFHNESGGSIKNSGATSDTLINVDNTIAGGGTISISHFDNQAGGTVEATQQEGIALQISSATFSNEGTMVAQSRAVLDLGTDGQSGSLTNTGGILVASDGDLAISGNYTISGGGGIIGLKGPGGADITSDGTAASTFTNESNIDYGGEFGGSGQIGDEGFFGVTNDLTFHNSGGTVLVNGASNTLTLNTGSNTITDTEGGSFLAENAGQMDIDSAVTTGGDQSLFMGHLVGGGGTIEALNGGTVTISSAITPGGSGILFGNGQILIQGGTVVMATGGSDTTPINFNGGGTLQLNSSLNDVTLGTIGGMGLGDVIDLPYLLPLIGGVAVFNSGTLTLLTGVGGDVPSRFNTVASFQLSGSYTSANFTVKTDATGGVEIDYVNAPPPAATTADMIMRNGNNGDYEIYDLGNNAIQAADPLGQVGTEWQVAGVGAFDAPDTSDMILHNSNTGQFEIYDISNNNLTSAAAMGQVGLEWTVSGFGDFSSRSGETDMLMRNSNTGAFEIYDLANNGITSAAPMGQVGLEWSVAGFGDFSTSANETDMLMRNTNTGAFEVYDISNNTITSAAPMGQVGLEWSVAGFGDFSGNANETDMLMRNTNTGAFELYDISNNTIVSAVSMGQVGLEWQVAGFGPINGAGTSDMLMRNSNTGAFEIYDIANNQITAAAAMGQVGLEWSVAGIAADTSSGSAPANAQLVQAMASYAPSASTVAASSTLDQTSPIAATPFAAPGVQIRQT